MDIPAQREENLVKILEENEKNLMWSLVQIEEREREREREKSLRTFEK